eukprot:Gb_08101 [translate_table: standard]
MNSNMVSKPCKTCDSGSVCGQFSSLDLVYFGFSVFKPASCMFQGCVLVAVGFVKTLWCLQLKVTSVVKIHVHLMLFSVDYCRSVEDHVLLQTLGLQSCEIFEGEEQWLTLVETEVFEGILRVEDTWASSLKLWNVEEDGDGVRISVVVFKSPRGMWNDCGDLCGGADFIMFGRDVFGDHPLNRTASIRFVA